jgi:predicted nuclease with TOPRIM domain
VYDGAVRQRAVDHAARLKEQTHMDNDRTTEILNYLTAISRDVGELRVEVRQINAHLEQPEARLTNIEREQRLQGRRLDRIEGMSLIMRADVSELQDRVSALESKQA